MRRPRRAAPPGAAALVSREQGTIRKDAPLRVALVYPSPYRVAMASLGYQTIYRQINERPGACCERAILDGPDAPAPLRTLETGRAVADCPVVALSVATEAEVTLAARALIVAGLPPLEEERRGRDDLPLVVAGGPLTYADGTPLGAIADIVLCGEAEDTIDGILELLGEDLGRERLLEAAAKLPGALVPAVAEVARAEPARCDRHWLPAYAAVVSPDSELRDMFLVEPVRGCPRKCAFCVMEAGSYRVVSAEEVLATVPDHARRVGLVGSAIGYHPELRLLLERLVSTGRQVSLSSLRADRLDAELLELLVRGGLRTLTVAADGASERLREQVRKQVTAEVLLEAARLARAAGLKSIKLYAMTGLPSEEEEDLLELCDLAAAMASHLPVSLALSPFVPKAGTSLAEAPFSPMSEHRRRHATIRRALNGRVEVRPSSVRGAWIEQAVARGGGTAGRAAVEAAHDGCSYDAFRGALTRAGLG